MNPYNKAYITPDGSYSPELGPIEHLYFDPCLREWLLSIIATSGIEISYYLQHHLDLKLESSSEHGLLKGSCPWCGGEESFSFSTKSLFGECSICLRKDDILGLIAEKKQYTDIYLVFHELKYFMEHPPVGLVCIRAERKNRKKGRAL